MKYIIFKKIKEAETLVRALKEYIYADVMEDNNYMYGFSVDHYDFKKLLSG